MKYFANILLISLMFSVQLSALPKTKAGDEIPKIGFGTFGVQDKSSFLQAIKHGYRLFDTAESYQNGGVLAQAIKESRVPREKLFVVYKIMPERGADHFMAVTLQAIKDYGYLDAIMLHDMVVDRDQVIEDILASLKPLIEKGDIRYFGLSNVEVFDLERESLPKVSLIQNRFGTNKLDAEMRAYCKAHDIAYMGYSLFNNSDLRGFRAASQKWERLGVAVSPHQLAISWAVSEGTIQIPRTKTEKRMVENLDSQKPLRPFSVLGELLADQPNLFEAAAEVLLKKAIL